MKEEVSKTEVISNNEIIFLSTINNMYIKSVDEDNIPIEYTKDIKYALYLYLIQLILKIQLNI